MISLHATVNFHQIERMRNSNGHFRMDKRIKQKGKKEKMMATATTTIMISFSYTFLYDSGFSLSFPFVAAVVVRLSEMVIL